MKPPLPPEAIDHYEQIDESNRLNRVVGQVELVRTQELMERFLPEPPATVLDVGGAAGIHAFWLARRGYKMHLIDAMPRHIEQAREAAQQQSNAPLTSIEVGDARDLRHANQSVDVVLLFGPLYHLIEKGDRQQCLREAHRVLRPGGVLMAVGISKFISTVNCLTMGLLENADFVSIVERDLQDGQHRNPTSDQSYFTTTFFHHPDELQHEVESAGFRLQHLLAVEGPTTLLRDFANQWRHNERRQWLLQMIRKVESERHLLGVSTHVMAIAHR